MFIVHQMGKGDTNYRFDDQTLTVLECGCRHKTNVMYFRYVLVQIESYRPSRNVVTSLGVSTLSR